MEAHREGETSPRAGAAEDCLAGGGELGTLMRSMDWSKTPLGPVAWWPQSLRTSVSIMLSSGFPLFRQALGGETVAPVSPRPRA